MTASHPIGVATNTATEARSAADAQNPQPLTPNKVLVLLAHPNPRASRAGTALRRAVETLPGVTVHDLYSEYPDFLVNVKREQALMQEHGLVVFQHPFYWYSCPPLLKLWLDDVLEFGWAYGDNGTALRGKTLWSVITTGGPSSAYGPEGYNRFEMGTLLSPFDQTACLCGMRYARPYVLHSAPRIEDAALAEAAEAYRAALFAYTMHGTEP